MRLFCRVIFGKMRFYFMVVFVWRKYCVEGILVWVVIVGIGVCLGGWYRREGSFFCIGVLVEGEF